MSYLRIFAIFISLLGFGEKCHANGDIEPPSVSSGEIMILPPPENKPEQMAYDTGSGLAKIFESGKWLAMACDSDTDKCRLVPVMLKVTKNHLQKGQSPDFFIPQTMKWDLSAISKSENIVMFVMPHAGLEPSEVQTWYVWQKPKPTGGAVRSGYGIAKTGEETVVATSLVDKPERQSIVVPLAVTNKSCTKAQAANDECERETFRVQLREGKTSQWMGAPLTSPCYPMFGNDGIPSNYLRWVGDLDHDQKPDYVINLGRYDGYILMLSSLAKPGQLVGEAGHFKMGIMCD
jgi:hypothetical protein